MEMLSYEVSTPSEPIHTSDDVNMKILRVDSGCALLESATNSSPTAKGTDSDSDAIEVKLVSKGLNLDHVDGSLASCAIDDSTETLVEDTGVMSWLERDLAQGSLNSTLGQEWANQTLYDDNLSKKLFQKIQPKKSSGVSLLSQRLAEQGNDNSKSPATIRPPPGFEHLGPQKMPNNNKPSITVRPPPGFEHLGFRKLPSNNKTLTIVHPPPGFEHLGTREMPNNSKSSTTVPLPPGFEHLGFRELPSNNKPLTTVRPPPGFEHLGARKISNKHGHDKVISDRDNFVPLPELRRFCAAGHPGRKGPSECWRAGKVTETPGVKTLRRAYRMPLPVQACVDCVVVPYRTKGFKDIEDWYLYDELHQIANF